MHGGGGFEGEKGGGEGGREGTVTAMAMAGANDGVVGKMGWPGGKGGGDVNNAAAPYGGGGERALKGGRGGAEV